MQLSSKRTIAVHIIVFLVMVVAVSCPVHAQKQPANADVAAAQLDLVRAQIKTEQARIDYYRGLTEVNNGTLKAHAVPFVSKFVADPADAVAAFGAIIGFFIAFFVLMGSREQNRRHWRDMEFFDALRRYGDGTTPAMRVGASGVLGLMGGIRDRRSYPYLDTAVDQLIAGHRLEENGAVRDAIMGALKQLILAEPVRVRRKLSGAGIKLMDD